MNFNPETLKNFLPALPDDSMPITWWLAFSGGLDSSVLLHALIELHLPVKLHALYINHQISVNANAWQQHCHSVCEHFGVPFSAVTVTVENTGRGLEDAARNARYAVFEQHLQNGDYLFTAHHADDQAETLLLRLMRGAGPRGLAGITRSRVLGSGFLHRPLLNFTRAELEAYARQHQLVWVDDESNENDHYDRNYLRNNLMPLLQKRWPHFQEKWQQTAELCATSEKLAEDIAAQDFVLADCKVEILGTSILLSFFADLSIERRHNLLRFWLRKQGLNIPTQQHLSQVEHQIISARQDAKTQVDWGDVSVRLYRNRVYLLPLADLPDEELFASMIIPFLPEAEGCVNLPNGCQLHFAQASVSETPSLKPDLPNLQVRFRQGGERCRPAGRAHSQTLKRLLQDYAVAPWLRESLPLIYSHGDLVAVGDLWICEGYAVEEGGYRLKYQQNPK
jgi:tRNA(Ile)-lysidine synthase